MIFIIIGACRFFSVFGGFFGDFLQEFLKKYFFSYFWLKTFGSFFSCFGAFWNLKKLRGFLEEILKFFFVWFENFGGLDDIKLILKKKNNYFI